MCVDVAACGSLEGDTLSFDLVVYYASILVLGLYEVVLGGESVVDVCVDYLYVE